MTKNKKEEISAIPSLLSVFPPLALLFIIAGWIKGQKISLLTVVIAAASVVLSIAFVIQLYKPL